jgi:hypothetical protein
MNVDLGVYVANGEVPTDPAELERLMNSWGEEGDKAEQTEDDAAVGVAEAEVKDDAGEKEPDGILSKDGKHVIPYSALATERQAKQDLLARIAELEAEKAAGNTVGDAQTEIDMSAFKAMTDEEKADFKAFLPDRFDAMEKLLERGPAILAENEAMRRENAELKQSQAKRDQDDAKAAANSVQEIIDNNKVLSHWQRTNPEIYEHCKALDEVAKQNPINAKLSLAERFEKVVQQALVDYPHPFPGDKPKTVASNGVKPAADKAKPPISSLTSIKGGEAPEASLAEKVEKATPAEINAMLAGKSQKEQDAFLMQLSMNT